ncbi:hypothetical protein Taro_029609, partial [Colocasia esculenta]|nr:hypothetical protein [Colocasia esculenta]
APSVTVVIVEAGPRLSRRPPSSSSKEDGRSSCAHCSPCFRARGEAWVVIAVLCSFIQASFDSNIEKPCMLLLDSLLSIGARSLQVQIISFVKDIYKALGREVDKDIIAQIPLHVPKLTGAWFNREEVDKFDEEVRLFLARNKDNVTSEVDFPDMNEEEMEEEQKPVKTASSRKRGYTTCHHVYAMEEGRRICVVWNDIGQPVGPVRISHPLLQEENGTEKLKSLKSAQPLSDDSTPHQVAARNDTYTQVLGPDRPGRVSGVGTGPTPTSMWGNESKEALRSENRLLIQRMTELETSMAKKFAKMESMIRGSQAKNDVDIEMQHVADGILISTEIEKVVMGRKIGTEYCFEKPSAIQQRGIVLELDVIQQAQSGMEMYDQVPESTTGGGAGIGVSFGVGTLASSSRVGECALARVLLPAIA